MAALITGASTVTTTAVYREVGDSRVLEDTSYRPFGLVRLGLMATTTILAVIAGVLYSRGRRKASERLLIATGVAGLIGIIPGALAFLALLVEKKTSKAR